MFHEFEDLPAQVKVGRTQINSEVLVSCSANHFGAGCCGSLNRHPQLDRVIRRVDQVLLRAQIALRGLLRRMSQQQLDLLKFAAPGSAQLCAGSAEVVRRDTGDARYLGIGLDKLPR